MQTNAYPEIDSAELDAVRRFLTSARDEERQARSAPIPLASRGGVTMRNGITRARSRSAAKAEA